MVTPDELLALLDQRYERRKPNTPSLARGTVTAVSSGGLVTVQRTGESAPDGEAYTTLIPAIVGDDVVLMPWPDDKSHTRLLAVGALSAPKVLRPVWLASPVTILSGAAYTTNVETGTALSIASAVPANARWACIQLTTRCSVAGSDAFYQITLPVSGSTTGVVTGGAIANNVNCYTYGIWVPVANQNVYVRRHCNGGTLTVTLAIIGWAP